VVNVNEGCLQWFVYFFSQGLMERLQLGSPSSHLLSHASGLDRGLYSREKAMEVSGVQYLAHCYARAHYESADAKVICA